MRFPVYFLLAAITFLGISSKATADDGGRLFFSVLTIQNNPQLAQLAQGAYPAPKVVVAGNALRDRVGCGFQPNLPIADKWNLKWYEFFINGSFWTSNPPSYQQSCSGTIGDSFNFQSNSGRSSVHNYKIKAAVLGTKLAGVGPQIALLIDGVVVATIDQIPDPITLPNGLQGIPEVEFSAPNVANGVHSVSIAFLNDAVSATEDRNLFVSGLIIDEDKSAGIDADADDAD